MNDTYHRFYCWYIGLAGSVPDGKLITIVRLTLLFAAPTAIYYRAFISRNREGFGRFVAAIAADGLILAMPIRVPYDTTARAWLLAGCLLLLAYIPGAHPFLVYKEVGRQRRLRTGMYVAVVFLLFVGLLWS